MRRRIQICRDRVADQEAADRMDPSVADRADRTGILAVRGWDGSQDRPMADRLLGADRPADRTMADASHGDAAVACRSSVLWRLQSSAQSCSRFCYKKHPHIALAMCGCFCGKSLTKRVKCGTIRSTKTGGRKNVYRGVYSDIFGKTGAAF